MIVSNMSDKEVLKEAKRQYIFARAISKDIVEELFKRFESLAEYKPPTSQSIRHMYD